MMMSNIPIDLKKDIDQENIKFNEMKLEWEEERKWIFVTVFPYQGNHAKSIKIHGDRTIYDLCQKIIETFKDEKKNNEKDNEKEDTEFDLDYLFKQKRMRLRVFDPLKNILLLPFDNVDIILKDLIETGTNNKIKPFKVEIRNENEMFPEFIANAISIKLLVFKSTPTSEQGAFEENEMFENPIELFLPISANVGKLRELVSIKLNFNINETNLIWFSGNQANELIENDFLIKELNFQHGDTIHVERFLKKNNIDKENDKDIEVEMLSELKLMAYFEGLSNSATINFNDPSMDVEAPPPPLPSSSDSSSDSSSNSSSSDSSSNSVVSLLSEMNQITNKTMVKSVVIDLRKTLLDLKIMISKELNNQYDINEFKVRRTLGGIELKDLNMSLLEYGLLEGSTINIKLGKPLKPGEYQFIVKYCTPPQYKDSKEDSENNSESKESNSSSESAISLGVIVVQEDMEISEFKKLLYETFNHKKITKIIKNESNIESKKEEGKEEEELVQLPELNRFRLRLAVGTGVPGGISLKGVFPDDSTIASVYGEGICDGKTVAIQSIISSEEVFTKQHMLIRIRLWRPKSIKLYPIEEIGVLRTNTIDDLKTRLAIIFNNMNLTSQNNDNDDDDNNNTPLILTKDDISVVKPFSYLLKDLENMKKLKWDVKIKNDAILTETPFRLKDGDLLVFKYNKDLENISSQDEASNDKENNNKRISSTEVGFNIYTPAQQLQREEIKKQEEKARVVEENEKVLEVRSRMEALLEATCNEQMKEE